MRGPDRDEWVVWKATHPSWSYTQLPPEIAEMIGFTGVTAADASKMARTLAFLSRAPHVVRVICMAASPDLVAKELARGRIVAQALPDPRLSFNFPEDLRRHLGLRTYPSKKTPSATRTQDCIAWMLRLDEWDRFRDATMEGGDFKLKRGEELHVYLARAQFPGIIPNLDLMERGVEVTHETVLAETGGRRRATH